MPGDDVRADLESARASRRRRVVVVTAIVVAATLVLGVSALWATDVIQLGGGPRAALADHPTTTTTRRGTNHTEVAPPPCRESLTPEEPLRLWIAGDSLAGSLGPSLGGLAGATGVVQPVYDSRVSSGLSTPDFFDWPKHASSEIERLDPEVVVFIIGANDWRAPSEGGLDDSGAPKWRVEYALRVEEMIDTLEGANAGSRVRPVYWVGSPPLEDDKMDSGVRAVDAVARTVIAEHPEATYVDAYQLFADDAGKYTGTLPGLDGKPVRVRADDGVHFTPDGGDLLGADVFDRLDARCNVDDQAVPGAAKPVLRTKGATEVAGTNRTSASTAPPASPGPPPPAPSGTQPVAPPTSPQTSPSSPSSSPSTSPTTASTSPDTTPDSLPSGGGETP